MQELMTARYSQQSCAKAVVFSRRRRRMCERCVKLRKICPCSSIVVGVCCCSTQHTRSLFNM
jgi:hypothetical protein